MADATNTSPSFFARLKQHHIYRVAAWYGATIAVLIQVVARAFPYFGWSVAVPAVIIVLIAGFPVAIVLAWLLATPMNPASQTAWQKRRWKLGVVVTPIVIAAVVVSGIFAFRFSEHRAQHLAATQEVAKATLPVSTNTLAPSSVTAVPAESVAVLPFLNESGDKDQQYFSDGLSEDLITALSQLASLKVINRDSSFRFRDSQDSVQIIGKKLGVAHLLEGSVQKLGDEVRISAELVSVSDGSTLWSQHYDRPYKNLFALQDDITKSVAGALQAKLLIVPGAATQSDRPPSGNLTAYNAYLQGMFYYQRGSEADLHHALSEFAQAVRLDPGYAAAYAQTSLAWTLLGGYFLDLADKPHAYAEARAAADTALRLDPDLAEAHLEKGAVLVNADLDWSGARAEYRHALKLAPGNANAHFSLSTSEAEFGHVESAVKLVQQALAGNPLNAFWHDWLASYLGAFGRFDEAEAAARKSVELEPQQPLSYREVTYIEVLKGDAAAALAAAQQTPAGRNHDIAMAWALQLGSDHAVADAALQALIAKHAGDSSYQIAEVYALRRDPDKLFQWLDLAWTNRDNGIQYLLYDPVILRYRNDPRFAVFCHKVGLPATTDAKALL